MSKSSRQTSKRGNETGRRRAASGKKKRGSITQRPTQLEAGSADHNRLLSRSWVSGGEAFKLQDHGMQARSQQIDHRRRHGRTAQPIRRALRSRRIKTPNEDLDTPIRPTGEEMILRAPHRHGRARRSRQNVVARPHSPQPKSWNRRPAHHASIPPGAGTTTAISQLHRPAGHEIHEEACPRRPGHRPSPSVVAPRRRRQPQTRRPSPRQA